MNGFQFPFLYKLEADLIYVPDDKTGLDLSSFPRTLALRQEAFLPNLVLSLTLVLARGMSAEGPSRPCRASVWGGPRSLVAPRSCPWEGRAEARLPGPGEARRNEESAVVSIHPRSRRAVGGLLPGVQAKQQGPQHKPPTAACTVACMLVRGAEPTVSRPWVLRLFLTPHCCGDRHRVQQE